MQLALHTLDRQMECIRNMILITEHLFNQLNTWTQLEMVQMIDQEWDGLGERDEYYNQVLVLEEMLEMNPHYRSRNEAIQQKINERSACITQLHEMDQRISACFLSLKNKTSMQLSDLKLRNKAAQRYGDWQWNDPAFIDEQQ